MIDEIMRINDLSCPDYAINTRYRTRGKVGMKATRMEILVRIMNEITTMLHLKSLERIPENKLDERGGA